MYFDIWALAKERNSIIISGIVLAFIAGAITANPVVEAAGGWKGAFDDLINGITAVNLNPASTIGGSSISTGAHTIDTNTNAGTICGAGQFLDGDGTCDPNLGFVKISGGLSSSSAGTLGTTKNCLGKLVIVGFVTGLNPTSSLDESFAISDFEWKFTFTFGPGGDSVGIHIICVD